MSNKGRNLVMLIYLVVLVLGVAYVVAGNYVTSYWDFGLENARLFVGNREMSTGELNLLYAIFCLSFSIGLVYGITHNKDGVKIPLIVMVLILAIFLFVFPQFATVVVVWPIMVVSISANSMGINLGSDLITMSALTLGVVVIHSFILRLVKGFIEAKLRKKS